MKIPEESTFCTRCGEKIKHGPGISNRMLLLACGAAAISLSVAALSFFARSDRNPASPANPTNSSPGLTSAPTSNNSPKASPTLPAITVEPAGPKPSPTPLPLQDDAPPSSRNIVSSTLELHRTQWRPFRFVVGENLKNPRVTGIVSVADGRDVEVIVVDDHGLQEFSNSYSLFTKRVPSQYRVRVTNSMNVIIPIRDPGNYYLILSNRHAIFFKKIVKADLSLEYQ